MWFWCIVYAMAVRENRVKLSKLESLLEATRASLALGRNANTGDILRVGFSLDGYEVSRRVSRKGRNMGPAKHPY